MYYAQRRRDLFPPSKWETSIYSTGVGIGTNEKFEKMARTQKNKATSFHLGQLKAKLAKLKRELLTPSSGSGGGGGAGFDVARTGVASIGFIGFPSVGKSTLMSRLTGQHSEAAAYEFTTLTSVPGQVVYNGECLRWDAFVSKFLFWRNGEEDIHAAKYPKSFGIKKH